MESHQRALIALIDEVFFGSYVVVKTGFRQSEFVGDVSQRRRASTFGVKEFCCAR